MYKNIYVEKRGNLSPLIHIWDDKVGYQTFPYQDYHYELDKEGGISTMDGLQAKKIKGKYYIPYKEKSPDNIRYADVQIDLKYLVDKYYQDENASKNYSVLYYDIETEITDGFPEPSLAENSVTSIAYRFQEYKKYGEYITLLLDPDKKIKKTSLIIPFETEYELLKYWVDIFDKLYPDSIAGWNSHSFDDQYIINRCKKVLNNDYYLRMSPIRVISEAYDGHLNSQPYVIEGVQSWDMLRLYKNFTFSVKDSYRLGFIGKDEVGLDKIEYEGNLTDLYNEDVDRFIKYNIRDVEIIVELEKKKQIIALARMLSHLAHTPYKYIFFGSILEEGGVLTFLKQSNLIAINKPLIDKRPRFAGGFVDALYIGRKRWVYDLDLTSLYPSIIRTLNLSNETKVGRIFWSDDADRLIKIKDKDGSEIDKIAMSEIENYKYYLDFGEGKLDDTLFRIKFNGTIAEERFSGGELRQLIQEEKYTLSANGVFYRTDKEGIISKVLTSWFNKRVSINKELKLTTDKERASVLNLQQLGVKRLLNTLFGALALKTFRYHDIELAESITLTGQFIIKQSREIILNKMGIEVFDEDKYI